MKKFLLVPLISVVSLLSCSKTNNVIEDKLFCFDTLVNVKLYEGNENHLTDIKNIVSDIDKLTDNYLNRGINNVYTLNHTNYDTAVDKSLYNLIKASMDFNKDYSSYFNPLCGSLAKAWKESLKNGEVLSNEVINEELIKMNNSSIVLLENNTIRRNGSSEIDLGGVAKGYALDKVLEYFQTQNLKHYLIDGGNSSILLGEKDSEDGLFTVGIKNIPNGYLKLKNCFVSTSSISTQGVTINGLTYSHIVNPSDGGALNKHEAVVVVGNNGFLGDALSTSMMLMTLEEIKTMEEKAAVQVIVIDNGQISYKNPGIEVFFH